jgi:hypothetical protein
MFYLPKGRK